MLQCDLQGMMRMIPVYETFLSHLALYILAFNILAFQHVHAIRLNLLTLVHLVLTQDDAKV